MNRFYIAAALNEDKSFHIWTNEGFVSAGRSDGTGTIYFNSRKGAENYINENKKEIESDLSQCVKFELEIVEIEL